MHSGISQAKRKHKKRDCDLFRSLSCFVRLNAQYADDAAEAEQAEGAAVVLAEYQQV